MNTDALFNPRIISGFHVSLFPRRRKHFCSFRNFGDVIFKHSSDGFFALFSPTLLESFYFRFFSPDNYPGSCLIGRPPQYTDVNVAAIRINWRLTKGVRTEAVPDEEEDDNRPRFSQNLDFRSSTASFSAVYAIAFFITALTVKISQG